MARFAETIKLIHSTSNVKMPYLTDEIGLKQAAKYHLEEAYLMARKHGDNIIEALDDWDFIDDEFLKESYTTGVPVPFECKFPKYEEEVLSPGELLRIYWQERSALDSKIDSALKEIQNLLGIQI